MDIGIAEIIILALLGSYLLGKVHIPGLVAMLALGVILGPYALGWIDPALLAVGQDLRLIALIVILLRAGFQMSLGVLRHIYGRALLLSFIPATVEALAITLIGPMLLPLSYFQSALLGSVIAAVSPAVVVPMMINFIEQQKGAIKNIPALVLASASIDDVYVIVVHGVLLGLYIGQDIWIGRQLVNIPLSLVSGAAVGLGLGVCCYKVFDKFNPRATKRVLAIIAVSALLVRLEHLIGAYIPFAAFVATMAIGFIILEKREQTAHEIAAKLARIWIFAEIVLFTMVGAQVDISIAVQAGLAGAAVIGAGLIARAFAAYACLAGSGFTGGEMLFVVVSFMPKATVQAAIAAGPLMAMRTAGLDTYPGHVILAIGVLSIVLTAPAGAWAISYLGKKVLSQDAADQRPSVS